MYGQALGLQLRERLLITMTTGWNFGELVVSPEGHSSLGRTHVVSFGPSTVVFTGPDRTSTTTYGRVLGMFLYVSPSGRPEGPLRKAGRLALSFMSAGGQEFDTGWSEMTIELTNPIDEWTVKLDPGPMPRWQRHALEELIQACSNRKSVPLLGDTSWLHESLSPLLADGESWRSRKKLQRWFDECVSRQRGLPPP